MVEFAITVPLFFLLAFGLVDFGRAFYAQATLQNAMRQAGRFAVTGNHTGNLTRENSILQIAQNAAVGLSVSNISITSVSGGVTSTNAGGPGATETISLTTQLKLFTPLIGKFFGSNGVYKFTVSAAFKNEPFAPSDTN